jgi:hypothetical protein
MKRAIIASMLGAAAFAVGTEARAQAGAGWGLHTGDSLRSGDNMVYGEFGWPDVSLGFQHGMSDKIDLGFRLSLDYGYDFSTGTGLGMGMRVPIRIGVIKGPKVSALIHFDPGIKFDLFSPVFFGMQIPVGFELGIHFIPEATLQFGFDMPLYINFTHFVYANIPVLFGFGFEYHVDDHIAIGINTRFGPTIVAGGGGGLGGGFTGTAFGFITQAGFAYRL